MAAAILSPRVFFRFASSQFVSEPNRQFLGVRSRTSVVRWSPRIPLLLCGIWSQIDYYSPRGKERKAGASKRSCYRHGAKPRPPPQTHINLTTTAASLIMADKCSEGTISSAIFRRSLTFDPSDSQTKGTRWEKWIRRFERYLLATCKGHTDKQVKDLFLNLVGNNIEDLLVMFPPESITTDKGLIKCLTDSFDPQQNVDFETLHVQLGMPMAAHG
ncbi:hypothetical protein NDU88_006939 [Pleurodeles waltl]|uniref:Uncharacterized protein n=1 Tax=Pleurodeles waltl TaxID=8319 RepID=A0AAV7NRT9_PLEWA|nr:hypothetical protein NDU88_006939 [Pleurodeles waltl]